MKILILILMLIASLGFSQGTVEDIFLQNRETAKLTSVSYTPVDEVIKTKNYIVLMFNGNVIVNRIKFTDHDSVYAYHNVPENTFETTTPETDTTVIKTILTYDVIVENKEENNFIILSEYFLLAFDLWRKNAK